MNLVRCATWAALLVTSALGTIKNDPICVFNGNIVGSLETRTIGGKLYLSATELARDVDGSVKMQDYDTLVIKVPMQLANPVLPATNGAWSKARTADWAQRVAEWCDKTTTLLSLIDISQISCENEVVKESYIETLKGERMRIKMMGLRAAQVVKRPITVIALDQELSGSELIGVAQPNRSDPIIGAPSPELALQIAHQATLAAQLSFEASDHARAVEIWYADAVQPRW